MRQSAAAIVLSGLVGLGVAVNGQESEPQARAIADPTDGASQASVRFDDVAKWTKTLDDPARDAWQMPSRVIDALHLVRGQTVADVGAATGYFTLALAKSPTAPRVFAVDVEPSMVAYVRERAAAEGLGNVTAVQADVHRANLPYPVDVVLLVDTYRYLSNRVSYFTTLRLRMKQTARLAVIEARPGAPATSAEESRLTPEQISSELAKAGFLLETQHDFLPRQHFLVYRLNP